MSSVIEDLFECTICLDVPAASPINTCSNGHIICGICVEKINKCGLCQAELHVSVLAERFSRQLDFKSQCPNFDIGCHKLIAATYVKDHVPKCYYRNAICNERTIEICNNVSIPLLDFPSHLEEKHKCSKLLKSLRSARTTDNKLPENGKWPLEIIEKDGKNFLLHNVIAKDVVHFWVTGLCDKEEAMQYMYEFTVENETEGKGKMKCSWTLPVLPYHDYPNFEASSMPSPLFVAIPEPNFIQLCTWNGEKYHFTTTQRIL